MDIQKTKIGQNLPTRPRELLCRVNKMAGAVWKKADLYRELRGRNGNPDWHKSCFLPRELWLQVLAGMVSPERREDTQMRVFSLAAIGAWRTTQGIYSFDETMFEALSRTPITGHMPVEALQGMPEWCIYILTPSLQIAGAPVYGAYVYLDWSIHREELSLTILLDLPDLMLCVSFPLGKSTVEQAVRNVLGESSVRVLDEAGSHLVPHLSVQDEAHAINVVISLLLYICGENGRLDEGAERPMNPTSKKTRKGFRTFPAEAISIWEVGVREGAKLRREYEIWERDAANNGTGSHASPRPHSRVAHWHHYWFGTKGSLQRKCIPVWVNSVLVNVKDPMELTATVRGVGSANEPYNRVA